MLDAEKFKRSLWRISTEKLDLAREEYELMGQPEKAALVNEVLQERASQHDAMERVEE